MDSTLAILPATVVGVNTPSRVVALGHAIVDVLAFCEDDALDALGLAKSTMTLVEPPRAREIQASVVVSAMSSGGSAANTAVSLAALGVPTTFVGRVADDELGDFFASDIASSGVRFASGTSPVAPGAGAGSPSAFSSSQPCGTGSAIVLVSPDAERTMCTSLGIGGTVSVADVDTSEVAAADVVYIEGYLCGKPETESAVTAALDAAAKAGTTVALSASDPFWVHLHGDAIRGLLDSVDVLFANEAEALGLSGESDTSSAVKFLAEKCGTVVVTLGAAGSLVASNGELIQVPADKVDSVVDTTGAGDSFAAGYLYGIINNLGERRSAEIGSRLAAEVITHLGARPLPGKVLKID